MSADADTAASTHEAHARVAHRQRPPRNAEHCNGHRRLSRNFAQASCASLRRVPPEGFARGVSAQRDVMRALLSISPPPPPPAPPPPPWQQPQQQQRRASAATDTGAHGSAASRGVGQRTSERWSDSWPSRDGQGIRGYDRSGAVRRTKQRGVATRGDHPWRKAATSGVDSSAAAPRAAAATATRIASAAHRRGSGSQQTSKVTTSADARVLRQRCAPSYEALPRRGSRRGPRPAVRVAISMRTLFETVARIAIADGGCERIAHERDLRRRYSPSASAIPALPP